MTKNINIELFWSFRSPYSYLAVKRYLELEAKFGVKINLHLVYPIAIRTPEFFKAVNPLWVPYLMQDVFRIAEYEGLSISMPNPDPVNMDMATRIISPQQPHIYRLTRLGVEAAQRGKGMAFINQVSKIIWSGEVQGWDKGEHLAQATKRAGLDLEQMEQAVLGHEELLDEKIRANQQALEKAGHWGVPTLVVNGEPFFGQDRIKLAQWRIEKLFKAGS